MKTFTVWVKSKLLFGCKKAHYLRPLRRCAVLQEAPFALEVTAVFSHKYCLNVTVLLAESKLLWFHSMQTNYIWVPKGKKKRFCFFLEVFRDLLCILLSSLQASGALLEGGSLLSKDIIWCFDDTNTSAQNLLKVCNWVEIWWLWRPKHVTHHSDTDQWAGWRRCHPGLDHNRNISLRGKGDHSEQVVIDLYRSFQIKGQAGPNHAGKITFAALKSHQILYGSRVNIFPLICHMCFSFLIKKKKVLSNMIWFKNVRRRSLHKTFNTLMLWWRFHLE